MIYATIRQNTIDNKQTRLQVLKPTEGGLYTGFWNAFSKVRTVEGGSRMWKGVSSVVIGAGMASSRSRGALTDRVS